MKIRTTLALGVAALTLGVPVAAAVPDGYQPQLQGGLSPDAIERYLRNAAPVEPDAVARYLRNRTTSSSPSFENNGPAAHPDSRAARSGPAVELAAASGGHDWTTGAVGAVGGALLALLAIVGASAIRERRRLVLR
jgi:hypothetical protein